MPITAVSPLAKNNGLVCEFIADKNGKLRPKQKKWLPEEKCPTFTHRETNDNEIVLETDFKKETLAESQKANRGFWSEKIKPVLDEKKIGYKAYFSGSKSIHAHILFDKNLTAEERVAWLKETFPKNVFKEFDDQMFNKRRQMVLAEGKSNPRTGKAKTLIEEAEPSINKFELKKPVETTPTEKQEARVKLTADEILKKPEATEQERVSCIVKLYKRYGWNEHELLAHITKQNKWADFNASFTQKKINALLTKYAPDYKSQQNYLGIKIYNPANDVSIKDLFYESVDLQHSGAATTAKRNYKIYKLKFSEATTAKNYYLATEPTKVLLLGETSAYLRPADVVNNAGDLEILESCRPPTNILLKLTAIEKSPANATYEEILQMVAQKQKEKPFLFVETSGVSREEIENLTTEQWKTALHDFIHENYEKDGLLELIYTSDLIKPNPQLIRPKYYQPYNSHELVFTNSKIGKTHAADKCSANVDKASTANLLGFSTANKKIEGSLNGQTETLTIDEAQESSEEGAHAALSRYMETGETEVRKGSENVRVRGYASLRWQGNPKADTLIDSLYHEDEEILFQQITNCLNKITKNHEAFGGRIAFIVFTKNVKPVIRSEKCVLNVRAVEQNKALLDSVFKMASDAFSLLFMNEEILRWLNTDLPKPYVDYLFSLSKSTELNSIRDFIRGHADLAKRHIRGKALKLACADHALELAKGEFDVNRILQDAEEYLSDILTINRQSLGSLQKASANKEAIQKYAEASFQQLPLQLKALLAAVEGMETTAEQLPFDQVKEFLRKNYDTTLSIEALSGRIIKNISRSNRKIEPFGVQLATVNETLIVCITDDWFIEKLRNKKGENNV